MDLIKEKLKRLVGFCKNNNWKLYVLADANSHNVVWGSTNTNGRGSKLFDSFFAEHDLTINNIIDLDRQELVSISIAEKSSNQR